jgi:heat shock protein HslJ
MARNGVLRLLIAVSLVIGVPAATAAQDGAVSPEGPRWDLVSYGVEGELVGVPWTVEATLLMEDGRAAGSAGCNTFDTGYTLADSSLTFDQAVAMTMMACPEDQTAVETGYMAALPLVASWATTDDRLELADADGAVLLAFEQPSVGFTASDVAAIAALFETQQAEIDRLGERVDNVRIGVLRDRINVLEDEVKTLRSQSSSGGSGTAFSAAEKVILEAIPASIKSSCSPRRSNNPAGTIAAVQCQPSTPVVNDMGYYLMESGAAGKAWDQRMDQYNVKDGPGACWKGKKDKQYYTPGPNVDGCYVADGLANLRYVVGFTNCKQVKAGNTQVKRPALYIGVLGNDNDLAKLTKWAEPVNGSGPEAIYKRIKRPNEAPSPMCPT